MIDFDFEGARQTGTSDADIVGFLKQQDIDFDIDAAMATVDGNATRLVDFFKAQQTSVVETPPVVETLDTPQPIESEDVTATVPSEVPTALPVGIPTEAVDPAVIYEQKLETYRAEKAKGLIEDEVGLEAGITEEVLLGAVSVPVLKSLGWVGSKLIEKWKFRGVPSEVRDIVKSKSKEELKGIVETYKYAKENDLNLFNQLILGNKEDVTTILNNSKEAKKFLNTMQGFEANEIKNITRLLDKVGEGQTFKELGGHFQGEARGLYKGKKDIATKLWDEIPETSNQLRHKTNDLTETILNRLSGPEGEHAQQAVVNYVKHQLLYKEKHLTPIQKAAINSLEAAKKKLTKLGDVDIDRLTPLEKGRHTRSIQAATRKKDNLIEETARYIETNYSTTSELISVVKALNHKIFVKGGAVEGGTPLTTRELSIAKEEIINYLNIVDPDTSSVWREASEASKEIFKLFGYAKKGSKEFPELGQILTKQNVDEVARTIVSQSSKFKLQEIDKILDKELAGDFMRKYMDETIGQLTNNKTVLSMSELSPTAIRGLQNLTTPDNLSYISKIAGKQVSADLVKVTNIIHKYHKEIKAIEDSVNVPDGKNLAGRFGDFMGYHLRSLKNAMTGQKRFYEDSRKIDDTMKAIERIIKNKHYTPQAKAQLISTATKGGIGSEVLEQGK